VVCHPLPICGRGVSRCKFSSHAPMFVTGDGRLVVEVTDVNCVIANSNGDVCVLKLDESGWVGHRIFSLLFYRGFDLVSRRSAVPFGHCGILQ